MSYYVKDSFDMPHNVGVKATVTRLDQVVLAKNLFGGYDAFIYADDSDTPTETVSNIRIGVENPAAREKLNLERWLPCYPNVDDVLFVCEYSGGVLYWYKVVYAYDNKTNE